MHCKKCNMKVSDESVYCEYCGDQLEIQKESPANQNEIRNEKKVIKKNKSEPENLLSIKNHLEFLGYDIGENVADEGEYRYYSSHPVKSNLIIYYVRDFGFLFTCNWKFQKNKIASKRTQFLNLINEMNKMAVLGSYCLNDEETLNCATFYPDIYSKKIFSNFIDSFEREVRKNITMEEIREYA